MRAELHRLLAIILNLGNDFTGILVESKISDNSQEVLQTIGFQICGSKDLDLMENLSKQNKRESFRKTMLNQEKIFKHQVHELHRLYTVQKSLMIEMNQRNLNSSTDGIQRAVRDEEIFRANGTSTSSTSIRPKLYLREIRGQSGNYDMHSDEESDDLDLTLSIGVKSVPKRDRQDLNCTNSTQSGTSTAWLYQTSS